jgi:site-specific recombinase XerD
VITKRNLQQLFDEFLYECEYARKVRPETLRGYVSTFTLFNKLMPETTCEKITSQTVVTFFRILQERKRIVGKGVVKIGIKKSTIATYWNKLNGFFKWLVTKHYINNNPFATLKYPSPSYDDKKFLKKEEIEKIIAAVHTHHDNNLLILKRNLVLFYLLLFCGLRREELMLLQIRDIDIERKILTVRADTSKSGTSRQLPLHSQLLLYLKDYLNERKHSITPYLIISSKRDERLTYDGLKHLVDKLRYYSGIPFHLHQFRHTFAVNFLKTNNNIAKLRQLLGHKTISMTMAYLRCLPVDELRSDIECMSIDNLI